MKSRWHWFTAATIAVFGVATTAMAGGVAVQLDDQSSASASQVSWTSSEQRLSEVEAELASLKQQVAVGAVDASCCDPCCRPSGIVAGAELTLLKPHMTGGMQGVSGRNLTFDYEAAPRFWLGYAGTSGFGMRVRYWEFDHDDSATSLGKPAGWRDRISLDTYTLDAEATVATVLGCNWDVLVSGGFRYMNFSGATTQRDANGLLQEGSDWYGFHGYGVTMATEARRNIRGNFGVFAIGRGSIVMGDGLARNVGNPANELWDDVKSIWEGQIGVDWQRELARGGALDLRVAAESQYWDGFTGTGGGIQADTFGPGAIGLSGLTLSASIAR